MTISSLSRIGRSVALRVVMLSLVVGALLGTAAPAQAAVDYCSADPVFTFEHTGLLAAYGLDVQLLVPSDQLPLRDAASLSVTVPSNVTTRAVNVPNPLIPLVVDTTARGAAAQDSRYTVELVALVPRAAAGFPVMLVITDPHSLQLYAFEGKAGQPLRATVVVGH